MNSSIEAIEFCPMCSINVCPDGCPHLKPLLATKRIYGLEQKLRHAMWAINSIKKLDISRTQASIIDVALEKIGEIK